MGKRINNVMILRVSHGPFHQDLLRDCSQPAVSKRHSVIHS